MQVPFFMAPDKIITPEKTHEFPLPKAKIKHNFQTTPGFIYQIQGVRESLLKGNSHLFVQGTFFFPFSMRYDLPLHLGIPPGDAAILPIHQD